MKKIVWIVLGAIAALAATIFLVLFIVGKAKYSGRELQQFNFYEVKDIEGGVRSLSITRAGDGRALLSEMNKEAYYQMPVVNECFVSEKILSDIEEIFKKNNLAFCENWGDSNEYAEDGSSWNISFAFDGRTANYTSYKKLPKREKAARAEILNLVEGYALNGEPLSRLVVDPITEEEWERIVSPDDGNVTVKIVYYWNNAIKLIISNGTEKRITYNHTFSIYRAGESKPVVHKDGEYEDEFIKHSYSEDLLSIPDRLEPGEYILEILGQRIEFEIE